MIDFIVTWVNPNDILWQKKYAEHKGINCSPNNPNFERYRENNMLKFWFRAIEMYAPWVNKIHLVTDNQTPDWLKKDHPKLNLVNHNDFIPKEYLPTFNSHTIELNLHRIKDLSEKFVYFNDDMFLNAPIESNFYFKNNLPCDYLILQPISPWNIDSYQFSSILLYNTTIINKNFNIKDFIKYNKNKFYSLVYSSRIIHNFFYYKYNKHFIGFNNHHLPQPYLLSTFNEVWANEYNNLDSTCEYKFRSAENISPYLFRYWQLAAGKFIPTNHRILGEYINMNPCNIDKIRNILKCENIKQICLNDNHLSTNDSIMQVYNLMKNKYPKKSQFEL